MQCLGYSCVGLIIKQHISGRKCRRLAIFLQLQLLKNCSSVFYRTSKSVRTSKFSIDNSHDNRGQTGSRFQRQRIVSAELSNIRSKTCAFTKSFFIFNSEKDTEKLDCALENIC